MSSTAARVVSELIKDLANPSKSIKDTYQKICMRNIYTGNWKKITFLKQSKILYINHRFIKGFTNRRKKPSRVAVFSCALLFDILVCIENRLKLPAFWKNMISSDWYSKLQLVCMRLQGSVLQNHHRYAIKTRCP